MNMLWFVIVFATVSIDLGRTQRRSLMCEENHKCVPLSECIVSGEGGFVYPCNEKETNVCCPTKNINVKDNSSTLESRTYAFPDVCGLVTSTDRITGGEVASIGQFPWMALIGYKQSGINFVQFLCGGSIITKEYILTAAHCINIDPRLKVVSVRLGELNLESNPDCDVSPTETICADNFVDVLIEKVIPHENYNNITLENDIALIKLKRKLNFTEYIQPICVPFKNDLDYKTTPNNKLLVSGWGKSDSTNIGGSSTLLFTDVLLWEHNRCNSSVPPRIRPIRKSQLCANGFKKQDACKGDSGGPLVNTTLVNNELKYYQVGIVSFASAQICGNAELPTIYSRVDYYLNWIVLNVV